MRVLIFHVCRVPYPHLNPCHVHESVSCPYFLANVVVCLNNCRVTELRTKESTTLDRWCPQVETWTTCSKSTRGKSNRQYEKHALTRTRLSRTSDTIHLEKYISPSAVQDASPSARTKNLYPPELYHKENSKKRGAVLETVSIVTYLQLQILNMETINLFSVWVG